MDNDHIRRAWNSSGTGMNPPTKILFIAGHLRAFAGNGELSGLSLHLCPFCVDVPACLVHESPSQWLSPVAHGVCDLTLQLLDSGTELGQVQARIIIAQALYEQVYNEGSEGRTSGYCPT